jgi:hypothetical protein
MNHVALWICSYPLLLALILKIAKVFLSRTLPTSPCLVAGAPRSYSSLPTPAVVEAEAVAPAVPVYDSATLEVACAITSMYPRLHCSEVTASTQRDAGSAVEALARTYVETSFPEEMKLRLARLIGALTGHVTREQDYTLVGDLFSSSPRKARAARKLFANGYWSELKTLSSKGRCDIYGIAISISKL